MYIGLFYMHLRSSCCDLQLCSNIVYCWDYESEFEVSFIGYFPCIWVSFIGLSAVAAAISSYPRTLHTAAAGIMKRSIKSVLYVTFHVYGSLL